MHVFRPQTHRQLWAFVGDRFGVWLPHRVFTPEHSSPFAFLADAFFHPADDLAAWSCRSGGKTLVASILAATDFLFADGLQARVLSGSEDQASHLYGYWTRWCRGALRRRLDGAISRLLTPVAGGRLEILAASQKRVRGPKVQRLYQDEVDEIDPDIAEAAAGMLDSRPNLPARTIYTSTWHRLDGPMGRLVKGCPDNGVRLHRWNLWECIARCKPDRHQHGKGCPHCPLGQDCLAKAREHFADPDRLIGVAAEARGFYAVQDAAKIWQRLSRQTVEAEYLCRRPSPRGLVYSDFDPAVHLRPKPAETLTHYRAIDWGYNVFVCLHLGVTASGVAWLLDTYKAQQGTLADHARAILAHPIQNVAATYCDPAGRGRSAQTGRSDIEEFRQLGIHCAYTLSRSWTPIAAGIRLVRSFLRPAHGPPRLFILDQPANRAFLDDVTSYVNRRVNDQYIDEPVQPQPAEHTMDALRYFFVNRFADRPVTLKPYAAV